MNGFEQIKSFYSWVFNNPDKVRPTHISLYLFLLNQNNRSMWVEWFKCPYDLAMQGACIGNKNTYYKCLDELQMYSLIEYKKGINNYKAPMIKLIQLYDSEPLTEQVSVPQSEPLYVPQTEPLSVLLNKNTYKLITDNILTINLKHKEVDFFISNLSEIEILPLNNKEQKRKKVAQKKENETIDATDDFLLLWNEYKSYRVAKKKTFKFANLRFEQMAFDKLYKLSNQNFETAKKIVTQTIENNWEGLFELKENKVVEPIVAGRQTLSTIQSNSDWSMIENPYAKK